jgi:hypothetical protein
MEAPPVKKSSIIIALIAVMLVLAGLAGCGTSQDDAVEAGGTGKALVLEFSQPG